MVIRMRHTRAHRDNRRAHHALSGAGLVACSKCGQMRMKHRACPNCGTYKERQVTDVHAKVHKKEAKKKSKAAASQEKSGK